MITREEVIVAEFAVKYFEAAPQDDMLEALSESTRQFKKLLKKIPKKHFDYAYAEGKWTLREVIQHIVDTEKVFAFRALWFSRKDPSPLPGFDENSWAGTAQAGTRKWKDLVDEFFSTRQSTQLFFESLNDDQLRCTGTANNNLMNVGGLGFMCAGHVNHHINIIRERYISQK